MVGSTWVVKTVALSNAILKVSNPSDLLKGLSSNEGITLVWDGAQARGKSVLRTSTSHPIDLSSP